MAVDHERDRKLSRQLRTVLGLFPASAARQNAPTSGANWPPAALGAGRDAKRVLGLCEKRQKLPGARGGSAAGACHKANLHMGYRLN